MLKLYIDAAVNGNPGLAGVGLVLVGENLHEQLAFPLVGKWDNHTAEWQALQLGLEYLIDHGYTDQLLMIYTDSKLVSDSFEKNYVKNQNFKPYFEMTSDLISKFPFVEIKWIPDSQNKGADNLAKQGLRKVK